jgi:hypothetical protein
MSDFSLEREFEQFAALVRSLEGATENNVTSEIFQAITASKTAIDGLRTLSSYANEVKDVNKRGEFMRIIGELSLELAETQMRLAERIRESDELRGQVSSLQKEIESLKNPEMQLVFREGSYYTTSNDGPFCTGCYDSERKMIRLSEMPQAMRPLGTYVCPKCKNKYGKGDAF